MSAFTRVGPSLWNWEPFTQLDSGPQVLWMALYTTAESKRIMPGLWQGSITAMAEAAHKPVDEARIYLDALLEAEMVEFDIKLRVLRLTQLPDAGESPPNGNVLRGWFRKFLTLPACAVRDAHVPLVRWLMDTWSRENGKPLSHGHEEAWKETFGRIAVPPPRRRGVRRLAESDTSTAVQPSLFAALVRPELTVPAPLLALPEGKLSTEDSISPEINKIRDSEMVREPWGSGSGLGSGSLRSEYRADDRVADLTGPSQPPDLSGGRDRVPDPLGPLLAMFGDVFGGTWNVAQMTPERGLVSDQVERLGEVDYALLGRWVKSRGTSHAFARELLSVPGRLVWAVSEAHRWQAAEDDRRAKARAMKAALDVSLAAVGLAGFVVS